jgi:hypothetical protein
MAHHDPADRDETRVRKVLPEKMSARMQQEYEYTLVRSLFSAAAQAIFPVQWRLIIDKRLAQRRIVLPPGARLSRVTRFLMTREAHGRYVEPIIRDMQLEYCDELAAGHIWHARWIAVRGHIQVLPNWVYGWIAHTVKGMFSSL